MQDGDTYGNNLDTVSPSIPPVDLPRCSSDYAAYPPISPVAPLCSSSPRWPPADPSSLSPTFQVGRYIPDRAGSESGRMIRVGFDGFSPWVICPETRGKTHLDDPGYLVPEFPGDLFDVRICILDGIVQDGRLEGRQVGHAVGREDVCHSLTI